MKKIFLTAAIAIALLGSASVYAADNTPGFSVKQAFNRQFTQAKDVEWIDTNKEGVYQAKFTFNNETVQAFFSEEGEFLGTTRQITKSQLPLLVINGLDKKYPDARLITAFEYSRNEGVIYYLTMVNSKGSMVVKATGNGDFTAYKKNVE